MQQEGNMSALASVRASSITGLTAQPRYLCQLFCCFIINKGRNRLRVWLRVIIFHMLTISGILYFFPSALQGGERDGVLEHGEGSTVLQISSDPWNPSQQYEFGSVSDFSKSTALTRIWQEQNAFSRELLEHVAIPSLMPKPNHREMPNNGKVFMATKVGLWHVGTSWTRAQLRILMVAEGISH